MPGFLRLNKHLARAAVAGSFIVDYERVRMIRHQSGQWKKLPSSAPCRSRMRCCLCKGYQVTFESSLRGGLLVYASRILNTKGRLAGKMGRV